MQVFFGINALMKPSLFSVALLLCATACALAGPEVIIKQRAKELNQQNNVRQGVAPPTQTPMPSAGATPAPQLSVSLTYFSSGLAGIRPETPATADQKQKLSQQLVAAAQGAKPALAKTSKLAEDLAAAMAEKPLPVSSRTRLVQELDAILNPGKYPQAKPEGIYADIQAIFQENGLSRNKAVAISDDVKAIGLEIQMGGAR